MLQMRADNKKWELADLGSSPTVIRKPIQGGENMISSALWSDGTPGWLRANEREVMDHDRCK